MRAWPLAMTLAGGCLAKPGPPAGVTGDGLGIVTVDAAPCMPSPLPQTFDDATADCGPGLMVQGSGTSMREGGTLAFSVAGEGEYRICVSTPIDAHSGVFLQVLGPSFTPGDMTYLALRSSTTTRAISLGVKDSLVTAFDSSLQPKKTKPFTGGDSWWRLIPDGTNGIRLETSSDGRSWTPFDVLSDAAIDPDANLIVEFGLIGSNESVTRSSSFDNFDVCPQ